MAEAFRVFQPLRKRMKVTIFGSARTEPDHPAYRQARALAATMAGAGWMVVTGAGPGIMAAGMEGAGRDQSVGVNIRLPHEQGANRFIAQDPKLVEMRYFFTRKLMLLKESDGFIVLPGWVRHPGRGVRAAHPPPDGQGRTGAGDHARRARAGPTGTGGAGSSPTSSSPGAWSPATTGPSSPSPTTSRRPRPSSWRSTGTTGRVAGWVTCSCCGWPSTRTRRNSPT